MLDIEHRQKRFRGCLGGGQKAGAKAGDGEDRGADGMGHPEVLSLKYQRRKILSSQLLARARSG